MTEDTVHRNIRELLILAGIQEINNYGLQNFSVRRIANDCGVSCAAPYKHFADRQSFFAAIIEYINKLWSERQQDILCKTNGSVRSQLLEISLDYVRFLVSNPHFRSIIMLKDEEFDTAYQKLRGQLSSTSLDLINKYGDEANIPDTVKSRKIYIIRSLIYGAALMFDNGEMDYTAETMRFVEYAIDREFDLP